MSVSATTGDYFSSRPTLRTRATPTVRGAQTTSPRSPRTPLLGRSISTQLGSPSTFRTEQEDTIIYELSSRYFAAGFAGESRPRCILPFTPDGGRRMGDYRPLAPNYEQNSRKLRLREDWGAGYELYRADLSSLDTGLVEDRLDRALREAHTDHLQLQLDSKPRKAVLILSSMFSNPLLEIALKVLFGHFHQPPSVTIFTRPILDTVGAGLRNALVVDIGWEETVVTAIGECREVRQQRSVRAGRLLTQQMASVIEHEAQKQSDRTAADVAMTFAEADELTQRMAWCRARQEPDEPGSSTKLPIPGSDPPAEFAMSFDKLAEATERTFFPVDRKPTEYDDHDLPLDMIVYRVLLALPLDFRALCLSRIIVTGTSGDIPGIKCRLLQEIQRLAESHKWDTVQNYGSAAVKRQQVLKERSANIALQVPQPESISANVALSPMKMPIQDGVTHADRVHDDIQDPVTLKAERESHRIRNEVVSRSIRGVETLGSWAGASMMVSLRVKGAHEIEREEFLKHGLRNVIMNDL